MNKRRRYQAKRLRALCQKFKRFDEDANRALARLAARRGVAPETVQQIEARLQTRILLHQLDVTARAEAFGLAPKSPFIPQARG